MKRVSYLQAVAGDRDQVPRRDAFEQAHPEVRINMVAPQAWQARIPVPGGEQIRTRRELSELLDVLEDMLPETGSPPG